MLFYSLTTYHRKAGCDEIIVDGFCGGDGGEHRVLGSDVSFTVGGQKSAPSGIYLSRNTAKVSACGGLLGANLRRFFSLATYCQFLCTFGGGRVCESLPMGIVCRDCSGRQRWMVGDVPWQGSQAGLVLP